MVLTRRSFIAALPAICSLPLLAADEKEPTFSSDVRVVNVFATVRDRQGHVVKDLNREDFTLSEDGRAQEIKYFARESDLPLTLGLLVDTSGSQRTVIGKERKASFRFLDKVLRPDKDKTFVIHFDFETELLQDLTSSREKLEKAMEALELPTQLRPRFFQRGRGNWPGGGRQNDPGGPFPRRGGGRGGQRAGTTLYDAVLLASDEITSKQTGRKALILLTDGVDMGSKSSLNDAIEAAQRADTLVFSILFTGQEQFGGRFGGREGLDGRTVLERISRQTGGSFYEVSKKQSIDVIFDRLQEELRNQYSLGYTSDAPAGSASFRNITLKTRRRDLVVQTREGYFPSH